MSSLVKDLDYNDDMVLWRDSPKQLLLTALTANLDLLELVAGFVGEIAQVAHLQATANTSRAIRANIGSSRS